MLGDFPHTPRAAYTLSQQKNLQCFERAIAQPTKEVMLKRDDVVVVSVDRAEGKAYAQVITINNYRAPTCHNIYLVVLSVRDVCDKTPDEQREYFRKLT
jgi:hypothetical protein